MAEQTIIASAARTTNGNVVFSVPDTVSLVNIVAQVTAVSGAGASMALAIEGRHPLSGDWFPIDTFAAITAVSTNQKIIGDNEPLPNQMRVTWTLTGTTPSFTFTLVAITRRAWR